MRETYVEEENRGAVKLPSVSGNNVSLQEHQTVDIYR